MSLDIHRKLLARTADNFPLAHSMVETNGVIILERRDKSEFFESMAKTVVGQQLSKQAATTIWNRIVEAAKFKNSSVETYCSEANIENLRSCGLSKFKIKAIILLKDALRNKAVCVDTLENATYDVIKSKIVNLWGFGEWSADMISLFFFANSDVWSNNDAALKRGLELIAPGGSKNKTKLVKAVRPYRSYLALHIWKAIDDKILK